MSQRTLNRIVDFFSNQTTLPLRRSTMESDSRSRLIENEADTREEGIDDIASEQDDNDDNQGTSWLMRLDPVAIAHHGSIANTPNRVASTVQLPLRNGSERIIIQVEGRNETEEMDLDNEADTNWLMSLDPEAIDHHGIIAAEQRENDVVARRLHLEDKKKERLKRPVITRQPSVTDHIISEIPEYLICAVCMSVFNQPYQGKCGHVFCLGCLHGTLRNKNTENCCPLCRCDIQKDSLGPNLIAKGLIDDLTTRCPARGEYNEETCEWEGLVGSLIDHQKTCKLHQLVQSAREDGAPFTSIDLVGREHELVRIPEHLTRYTADKDNKKDFAKNLGKVGMEDWNLWHAPGTRTAEVVVDLQYPQRVHHYKISNANYDKVHDPESWEVWGLREHSDSDSEDEEKKWVMLHKVVNMDGEPPFGQCWKWKSFTVCDPSNLYFRSIKLKITATVGGRDNVESGVTLGNFWLYQLPPYPGAQFAMPENTRYLFANRWIDGDSDEQQSEDDSDSAFNSIFDSEYDY